MWWIPEVEVRQKEYERIRRLYPQGRVNAFTLRAEQNFYYYTITRAKKQCSTGFRQSSDKILGDSEQCWTALRYTKPWASSSKTALKDVEGNMPTSLEGKTEILRRAAFPPPPEDLIGPLLHRNSMAYQRVSKNRVRQALFHPSQKKTPGLDILNFSTLWIQWG